MDGRCIIGVLCIFQDVVDEVGQVDGVDLVDEVAPGDELGEDRNLASCTCRIL